MATPESSAAYLAKVNFKPLMEWLTASVLLHRPKDPMLYCNELLQAKIKARGDVDTYEPRIASHYLTECYDEAMTHADENGVIWTTADKPNSNLSTAAALVKRQQSVPDAKQPAGTVQSSKTAPESQAPPKKKSTGNAAAAATAASAGSDENKVSIDEFFLPLVSAFVDGAEACSRELMAKSILACACKVFRADQAALYAAQGSTADSADAGASVSSSSRQSMCAKPLLQLGADFGSERRTVPRGKGTSLLSTAAHPPYPVTYVADTSVDSCYSEAVDVLGSGGPAKSMLVGPLLLHEMGEQGGALVGVLAVGNKAGSTQAGFTAADQKAFKAFSGLAAAMLRHAARYESKEKECTKFRSMVEIIEATNQQDSMGVNHILYTISSCLPRVCDAHKCTTFIVDEEHEELWAAQGEINIRMPRDKGIAGAVATSGKVINIPDAYKDPRFNQQVDLDTGYRTQTILAVPIRTAEGKVLGVVQLINKADMGDIHAGVFSKQDEEILNAFLGTLAPLLQSSKLFRRMEVKTPRGSREDCAPALALGMLGGSSNNLRIDGSSLRSTIKHEIAEGEEGEEEGEGDNDADEQDACLEFDENL